MRTGFARRCGLRGGGKIAVIMPKGNRKGGKKWKGGLRDTAEFWAPLAREIVGNFAGQIMAHKTTKPSKLKAEKHDGGNDKDRRRERRDVVGDVVRILAESGPRSVAQLVA